LPVEHYESQRKLEETTRWWDAWTSKLRYRGPYRLEVERSALALKLCAYEPSGAIVAAPTTSLPESPGGSRNWDYRFAWLRDSAFVLDALLQLDYHHEADRFVQFLKRVCRDTARPHVQILYAVDGRRDLPERELSHLAGYRGAAPVRVGNAAAGQRQLDVYGETLDTLAMWARHHPMTEGTWKTIVELVDWTAAHWREPDFSIWEARQEPRHYVFSKVMAWTALRRGADLAALDHPALAARWSAEAEAVHADVIDCGLGRGARHVRAGVWRAAARRRLAHHPGDRLSPGHRPARARHLGRSAARAGHQLRGPAVPLSRGGWPRRRRRRLRRLLLLDGAESGAGRRSGRKRTASSGCCCAAATTWGCSPRKSIRPQENSWATSRWRCPTPH